MERTPRLLLPRAMPLARRVDVVAVLIVVIACRRARADFAQGGRHRQRLPQLQSLSARLTPLSRSKESTPREPPGAFLGFHTRNGTRQAAQKGEKCAPRGRTGAHVQMRQHCHANGPARVAGPRAETRAPSCASSTRSLHLPPSVSPPKKASAASAPQTCNLRGARKCPCICALLLFHALLPPARRRT